MQELNAFVKRRHTQEKLIAHHRASQMAYSTNYGPVDPSTQAYTEHQLSCHMSIVESEFPDTKVFTIKAESIPDRDEVAMPRERNLF